MLAVHLRVRQRRQVSDLRLGVLRPVDLALGIYPGRTRLQIHPCTGPNRHTMTRHEFDTYAVWRSALESGIARAAPRDVAGFGLCLIETFLPILDYLPAAQFNESHQASQALLISRRSAHHVCSVLRAAVEMPSQVHADFAVVRSDLRRLLDDCSTSRSGLLEPSARATWYAALHIAILASEALESAAVALGWVEPDSEWRPSLVATLDDAITRLVIVRSYTVPDGEERRADSDALDFDELRLEMQRTTGDLLPQVRALLRSRPGNLDHLRMRLREVGKRFAEQLGIPVVSGS